MVYNTPSTSSRKTLNTEGLMGYANESSDVPLAMPVSDYSGRSSRSGLSRSPLQPTTRKSKSSHIRQGLKALLSPITPSVKKRSVLSPGDSRRSRTALSPKLFSASPKTAGGRKTYVMNKLAIQNLDDDDDDDGDSSIDSNPPMEIKPPTRRMSRPSLLNRLSLANLDDDDDDNVVKKDNNNNNNSRRSRRSLHIRDVFSNRNLVEEEQQEEQDVGPSELDVWREQRKMAMSADHVSCRDYLGNTTTATNDRSSNRSSSGLRAIFSNSDNHVRYSIRKDKKAAADASYDLAMLIVDEMEDSQEFDSKDF